MAPSLKPIRSLIDQPLWKSVQRYLFEEDSDSSFSDQNSSFNDSSQWEDVETDSEEMSDRSSDENGRIEKPGKASTELRRRHEARLSWLQHIHVATIPTFELFALANNRRLIILESTSHNEHWRMVFEKEITEEITAVVCLPVAPTRVTDPRPYEWTAILIGTSDGRLTAFSERGDELLTQRFNTKSVIEMKLQSDQLLLTYPDYLTAISGLTLLAALKSSRQRIMRQHVSRLYDDQQQPESQLVFEQWRLENTGQSVSIASTGPHRTSIWEKMVTASIKGGFNASVSNRQPSYETYCAANKKNFVSFNWWTDETHPNLLAGIASRIKSSVSVPIFSTSWWSPAKPSKPVDPATIVATPVASRDISQRSCLPDSGRAGETILPSPGNRLAAVCDDLGRVSLIDIQRRLLLRVWKGYRDAQCAWMELPYSAADNKKDGTVNRCNVLCLIVFAPRRGILEVWSSQNGRRAAAFNVDRRGTLIYCPATAMTRSNSIDYSQSTRFMDSAGRLFQIEVSSAVVTEFHEASTYWTVPAKEDFRKIWNGTVIAESSLNSLLAILERLPCAKDVTYLVDRIMEASKIDCKLFIRLVDAIISRLARDKEKSPDAKSLLTRCSAFRQITHFVALLLTYHERESTSSSEESTSEDEIYRLLAFRKSKHFDDFLKDLDSNLKIRFMSAKATNSKNADTVDSHRIIQQFLSSIDFRSIIHGPLSPSGSVPAEQTLRLRFGREIDHSTILDELGDFIFKPFVTGTHPIEEFRRSVQPLFGLIDRDWTRLFCAYWLHKDRPYSVHPETLYNLFNALAVRNSNGELDSEFLKEIRRLIIDCSRMAEAFSLCTVARALIKNSMTTSDSEWTKIEKNAEDWDILQTTLHSVLLIDTCCRYALLEKDRKKSIDFEPISLRQLLLIGDAGYLGEYVAKAIVTAGLALNANSFDSNQDQSPWMVSLNAARQLLPLTLDTERLILGILWEYVRLWHRTPSRSDCLISAGQLLQHVEDERLRQGFASLAWKTFCSEYYSKLCVCMVQSSGKDCSEIFERETSIPRSVLLEFVRFAYSLFNTMNESVERWQDGPSKPYDTEDFLNNFFVAFRHDVADERTANRESLWKLLSRQPANSKGQIQLHWELTAAILVAISTHFETRLNPFTLFSWDERGDLFKTLSRGSRDESKLSDEDAESQQLDNRRLLFLLSYVTVAIKTSLPSSTEKRDHAGEKTLLPDLSLAVKLARSWGLNFDAIRRQEVVQLYLAGFPDLASKLLPLVEERRLLATTLSDIAGCALSDRWSTSQATVKPKLSSGSWNWLISKKSAIASKGAELDLDTCDSMLVYVSSVMPRGSIEYKVSDELRSVIESLK